MPYIAAGGAIIGGLGSLFGGKKGAGNALKQFNYLKNSSIGKTYLPEGGHAEDAISQLLGLKPLSTGTHNAYNNYLDSAGYNFRLASGSNAITGNAASKGILNSGATGKALTAYGQNLGSEYFSNYLDQAGKVADRGLTAGDILGRAGNSGAAAQASAGGIGGATGNFLGALPSILGQSSDSLGGGVGTPLQSFGGI